MATVEFIYNGTTTMIQCQTDEKMEDVIEKFLCKVQKEKGSIFFLYAGKTLDEDLTFNEAINIIDKPKNLMKIQAWELLIDTDNTASLKKSNYVICPECYGSAFIDFDENYQIIFSCLNKHESKNIQLKDFEKSQLIDQTKIKCQVCKIINKSTSPHNSFFFCLNCKLNLCQKCKKAHEPEKHVIIDYEDKDFYCSTHYEKFYCYCLDCNKDNDICRLCKNKHIGHKCHTLEGILPEIDASKKELVNLKESIRKLRKDIKEIISKLNIVIDNLNNYYNIYYNIVSNFEVKKGNIMQQFNIYSFRKFNVNFMRNISEITNDKNLKTKFSQLIRLYEKMALTEKDKKEEEENKNEIKEKNNENNKDELIDEENYEKKIIRYNPSDNKYENFNLKQLSVRKKMETTSDIEFLMMLNDRRLLIHQKYRNDQNDLINRIGVYDLSSSMICDINYDLKGEISKIFQINDNNIIIYIECYFASLLKIFKIKKKSIEEIYSAECGFDIYKITNEKFLIINDIAYIYSYGNEKLIEECSIKIKDKFYVINACSINENEIVIYCTKKGKIYGENAFLLFFNIKNEELKKLKLGDHDDGGQMLLFDKNNLIVERKGKLVLIDPIKKNIKKEFKNVRDKNFERMILLNNKTFLIVDSDNNLYQYEINNNKINLISEKQLENSGCFDKYPYNAFIAKNGKEIVIYGY